MDDLDHPLPVHLVQVLPPEHHQTLEVHYQNLLPLAPKQEQEFVLQGPEMGSKSVAVVELLVKE
jgi:hypothetical protein